MSSDAKYMKHALLSKLQSAFVCLQTLLFSATMPSALHEFAKAGLKDPEMVRLDTDTKISSELSTAFFTVRYWYHSGLCPYRQGPMTQGCCDCALKGLHCIASLHLLAFDCMTPCKAVSKADNRYQAISRCMSLPSRCCMLCSTTLCCNTMNQ